jgi:hypothetical protein
MGIAIFSVLSVAACVFLIYVLVHFHRELVTLKKISAGDSNLIYIGSHETEPALPLVKSSPYAAERQHAWTEAAMRREILISGIVGLFGLLAPYIFVLLLNSSNMWHH